MSKKKPQHDEVLHYIYATPSSLSFGNTHFCESCHNKQCNGTYLNKTSKSKLPKCPGPDECPLQIKHPPNGEEY